MKTASILFITFFAAISFVTALAVEPLTPKQRIDLLPLPDGVSVEQNADLSMNSIITFSQQHSDFAMMDPFLMERRAGSIPPYTAIRFTTSAPPRDMFLFFKRFFNTESKKTNSERKLPFYNSCSGFSFDAKNEADVTRDQTINGAVFYRIQAVGSQKRRVDIVVFNDGQSDKTTVYIIAQDEA